MADFRLRRKVKTKTPQLNVVPGLPVGTYLFQLVVEDQSGNQSRASQDKVVIVDDNGPIDPIGGGRSPVVTPVIPGRPIIRTP